MVFCEKKQKQCVPGELKVGDCWIALSLAVRSGLILAARVGKHTDQLIEALVVSSEGKRDCKQWNSDDWGGYQRILPPEILHYIGKDKTQRLERTNGIVRQQTGRWVVLQKLCEDRKPLWQEFRLGFVKWFVSSMKIR